MTKDLPIFCRESYALPDVASGEMMYMPGGLQQITPVRGGLKKNKDGTSPTITVMVDARGAAELERQRVALEARGKKPFFDFNHVDGEASYWPTSFFWKDGPVPGIYCKGEWTATGEAKVKGKEWRQFSPVFHLDDKRAKPARIVCREWAKPNMGGLVNDPAFHDILPLWARDAGGAETETQPDQNMNEEELAALRAKNKELETELSALKAKEAELKAKNQTDALVASEIRAKEAEKRANDATLEVEALRAKSKSQSDAIAARNKADAEAAVKRAVERGAIAAKDTGTQDALVAKAAEDPGFVPVIDAMQGSQLGVRITPSGTNVEVTRNAPNAIMKAFAAVVARNAAIPLNAATAKDKGALARESAAIFAKDISEDNVLADMTMEEAVQAADVSSDQVGLLAGTLVLQRSLPLLQYEYPILSSIASDYSDSPGLWNQTEMTRIVLRPAVQNYDPTPDATGRPKGWVTVSSAQMVDVPVKLDEHVGVPIVFGTQTLGSTVRNLFGEVAPQAIHALGGRAVGKLTALMTAANFNAYAGTSVAGGETTDGEVEITVASTANMYPGQPISGTGIPANAHVAEVINGTTARITLPATATNTGLTFTLGGDKVPVAYAAYVKALADFGMASLGEIGAAMSTMEVPREGRFALLNSQYYYRLSQDPTFNTFFAAMRRPEVVTDASLPKLQGYNPLEAPYFPGSANRIGFAGHKAALVLKSRLPNDFTSAVGAMTPGSVTTVTAPGGISVLLVQYINLQGNYAEWRPEVMLGAAVGDRRCGLVLQSQ